MYNIASRLRDYTEHYKRALIVVNERKSIFGVHDGEITSNRDKGSLHVTLNRGRKSLRVQGCWWGRQVKQA